MLFVVGDIAVKLGLPPFSTGLWGCSAFASLVAVPEASMNKNNRVIFWQDDIGLSWQGAHMQTIAESASMQEAPNKHLWFRILVSNAAHHLTSLGTVNYVYHFEVLKISYSGFRSDLFVQSVQ